MSLFLVHADLQQEMDALVEDTRQVLTQTLIDWIALGARYKQVKAALPHGRWKVWVRDEVPTSYRSVAQFMRLAGDANICNIVHKSAHATLLPDDRTTLCELCGLESETFQTLIERGDIHPDMRRGEGKAAIAALSLPDTTPQLAKIADGNPDAGRYGAILADPPWPFETRSAGGRDRSPDRHYPTMTLDEIMALPVGDLAAPDCALFLWVTSNHLMEAGRVMAAWGFEFKSTAFVWVKEGAPGLGYWTRKQTELCLIGTRGKPRRLDAGVAEVITTSRGRHSEKPAETHARIQRLVGGPYIELFARKPRDGWHVWGNDPTLDNPEETS